MIDFNNEIGAKVGEYVKFKGISGITVYGYIAKIDGDEVGYIRDSLTRWGTSKQLIERTGVKISKDEFFDKVKRNAQTTSNEVIPNNTQLNKVIKKFTDDFDCDFQEIIELLG